MKKKEQDGSNLRPLLGGISVLATRSVEEGAEVGRAELWLQRQLATAVFRQVEASEGLESVPRCCRQVTLSRRLRRPEARRQHSHAEVHAGQVCLYETTR